MMKTLLKSILFLFVVSHQSFAQEENEKKIIPFELVEEAPYLSACKINSIEDKKKCFQDYINSHIKENFNYPAYAKEFDIQGRVYISFVIDDESGFVKDIVVKGEKEGLEVLEEECLKIANKLDVHFLPAIHKGENVAIIFKMPIYFKLETGSSRKEKKKS